MNKYFILIVCAGANLYSMNFNFPKTESPAPNCQKDLDAKGWTSYNWNSNNKPIFFECLVKELISDLKASYFGINLTKQIDSWIKYHYGQNHYDLYLWRFKLLKNLLIELLKTGKIALEEFQTREIKNYLLNTFRIQYDELEHAISSLQRNPHSIDYLINRKLSNQSWLQI